MVRIHPKPIIPFATTLLRQPEYLQAIGTISVEIVNLEMMMSYLLASILKIPQDAAEEIYFSPQAIGPRIVILKGASSIALRNYRLYVKKLEYICQKARSYSNKRNEIVHNAWGISSDMEGVISRKPPFNNKNLERSIPISEIEQTIHNVRNLIRQVYELAFLLEHEATYAPWKEIPPGPDGA